MTHKTRREFLEHSLLAAATAAAAGSPMTRTLFAEEQASASPNEKLRVAVLGVRGRGQSHLGAFLRRKDVDVVAIVDPDIAVGQTKGVKRVEEASGRKPAFYQDMRKVMEDTSIDIVSIATPNHWHALASVWAIQADKDVYVEKPVSHNVSEGRRIVEAARKRDKIVQTGTQARSATAVKEAIQYVHSGQIGEVKLARGLCYKQRGPIGARGEYKVPDGVDYSLWLGPAPEGPLTRPKLHYDWHWQWNTGNGDLGNQGIHQMDIARWGLGVNDLGDSVFSYGGRLGYTDAGETANTQVSVHEFGDKRLVFEVRGLKTDAPPNTNNTKVGVIFSGTEGYVVIPSNYSVAYAFDPDGKLVKKFSGDGDHFGNFLAAVRSRKVEDLNADILEGHLSSALCHVGNISYQMGESVPANEAAERLGANAENVETFQLVADHLSKNEIPLDKTDLKLGPQLTLNGPSEVFTGERASEANVRLTREYRKPFVLPETAEV